MHNKNNLWDVHLTLWLFQKSSALTGDHRPYSAGGVVGDRENAHQPKCRLLKKRKKKEKGG